MLTRHHQLSHCCASSGWVCAALSWQLIGHACTTCMHVVAGRVVVHGGLAQDKSVVGAAAVLEIEVAAHASHPAPSPSIPDSAVSSQRDLISFDDEPAAPGSPPQAPEGASLASATGGPTTCAIHSQSITCQCLSTPLSDTVEPVPWQRARPVEFVESCMTEGAQKLLHACSRRGARITCSREDP